MNLAASQSLMENSFNSPFKQGYCFRNLAGSDSGILPHKFVNASVRIHVNGQVLLTGTWHVLYVNKNFTTLKRPSEHCTSLTDRHFQIHPLKDDKFTLYKLLLDMFGRIHAKSVCTHNVSASSIAHIDIL